MFPELLPALSGMALSLTGTWALVRHYRHVMADAKAALTDARKVMS